MEKIIDEFSTLVKLEGNEPERICKLGQGEKCCAFLVTSPTGFECIRMDYPTNMSIFNRLEKGTMTAKGEGEWKECAWEGGI